MGSTSGSAMPRRLCQLDNVPCGSVSIRRTKCPVRWAASARPMARVLLPLPPFRVANTITSIENPSDHSGLRGSPNLHRHRDAERFSLRTFRPDPKEGVAVVRIIDHNDGQL